MIEFRQDLHHFKSSKASEERGLNMEVINQFPNMTESMLEDFNQTDFSEENFLGYHFQLSENTTRSSISDFPRLALFKCQSEFPVITRSSPLVDSSQETMNRKAKQVLVSFSGTPCAAFGNNCSVARNLKASVNSSSNSVFEYLMCVLIGFFVYSEVRRKEKKEM